MSSKNEMNSPIWLPGDYISVYNFIYKRLIINITNTHYYYIFNNDNRTRQSSANIEFIDIDHELYTDIFRELGSDSE